MRSWPGAALPLYCTSLGKALLAAHGREAAQDLLAGETFPARTGKTLTSFGALWADVAQHGERGFAVQDEEYLLGLRGAGACIYDEQGQPAAALSVTGPTVRIPAERLEQLGTLVAQVCQQITDAYGGKQPSDVSVAA